MSGVSLNSGRLIGTEVRARSGHFKFDKKVKWKNLVTAFRPLFLKFLEKAGDLLPRVASGRFGADMKVSLVNDGPGTFWLRVSRPKQP